MFCNKSIYKKVSSIFNFFRKKNRVLLVTSILKRRIVHVEHHNRAGTGAWRGGSHKRSAKSCGMKPWAFNESSVRVLFLRKKMSTTPSILNYKTFWLFSKIEFTFYLDITYISRYIANSMYQKVKVTYNLGRSE